MYFRLAGVFSFTFSHAHTLTASQIVSALVALSVWNVSLLLSLSLCAKSEMDEFDFFYKLNSLLTLQNVYLFHRCNLFHSTLTMVDTFFVMFPKIFNLFYIVCDYYVQFFFSLCHCCKRSGLLFDFATAFGLIFLLFTIHCSTTSLKIWSRAPMQYV